MDYCWNDFLRNVSKDFICQSSLPQILECFWNYCNNEKQYYFSLYEFCQKRNNKYDAQYWLEQYNYIVNGDNNGK